MYLAQDAVAAGVRSPSLATGEATTRQMLPTHEPRFLGNKSAERSLKRSLPLAGEGRGEGRRKPRKLFDYRHNPSTRSCWLQDALRAGNGTAARGALAMQRCSSRAIGA